jgi:hypothetical protein
MRTMGSVCVAVVAMWMGSAIVAMADDIEQELTSILPIDGTRFDEREWIQVIEPDGELANGDGQFWFGQRFARVEFNDALELSPLKMLTSNVRRGDLDHQGRLEIPKEADSEFVAVVTKKGYCQFATSRLFTMKSVQLKPWSRLEVAVLQDKQPRSDVDISVQSHMTSNGMFQGMMLIQSATTDKNGVATFERAVSGENRVVAEQQARDKKPAPPLDKSIDVFVPASESMKVILGNSPRKITGTLVFPENTQVRSFEMLEGKVSTDSDRQTAGVQIAEDGSFECDAVPDGQCTLVIRTKPNPNLRGPTFYASKSFECKPDGADTQAIGIIELTERGVGQAIHLPVANPPADVEDEFQSMQRVELVGMTNGDKPHYVFLDEQARLVRSLPEIAVPGGWATMAQYVAFAPEQDRLYLLSAYDARSQSQTLHVFEMSGKKLYSKSLAKGSCRIAIDPVSGHAWLLTVRSIGDSDITVLDQTGDAVMKIPIDAFALCYCQADKGMWAVGAKGAKRLNPKTGETMCSYELPRTIWALTDAVGHPEGGIVAIESSHPDIPTAFNALWRLDSEARPVAVLDSGRIRLTSLAVVGKGVWVAGKFVRETFFRGMTECGLVFDDQLSPMPAHRFTCSAVGNAKDANSLWILDRGEMQRVSLDEQGKRKTEFKAEYPYSPAFWTRGN